MKNTNTLVRKVYIAIYHILWYNIARFIFHWLITDNRLRYSQETKAFQTFVFLRRSNKHIASKFNDKL